jgi:hypothetical protein
MSIAIIRWRLGMEIDHVALLLTNSPNDPWNYISFYDPSDDISDKLLNLIGLKPDYEEKNFTSRPLYSTTDSKRNVITGDFYELHLQEYVVIPTLEDGNQYGFSETIIKDLWKKIYATKKLSSKKLEINQQNLNTTFENNSKIITHELETNTQQYDTFLQHLNTTLLTISSDQEKAKLLQTQQKILNAKQTTCDNKTITLAKLKDTKTQQELEIKNNSELLKEFPGFTNNINCAVFLYKLLQKADPKKHFHLENLNSVPSACEFINLSKKIKNDAIAKIKSTSNTIIVKEPQFRQLTTEQQTEISYNAMESLVSRFMSRG